MAVTGPDLLPKELQHFKERDISWLWKTLSQIIALPQDPSLTLVNRKRLIAQSLNSMKNLQSFVVELLDKHKNELLTESDIKWINRDDDRLLIWLIQKLNSIILFDSAGNRIFTNAWISTEQRYDETIRILDNWWVSRTSKLQYLGDFKIEWGNIYSPDKQTQWLKAKDLEQLKWAWDYFIFYGLAVFVPVPVTTKEYHAAVLASIDKMSYRNYAEKQLFITKMRKTWNQKKYRASEKAKKQYTFSLTKITRDRLNLLAEHYSVTAGEALEQLINEDFSNISQ